MNSIYSRKCLCVFLMLIILASTLIGCSKPNPESAVNEFFKALKSQDIKTAAALIGNKDWDPAANETQEEILKLVFGKVSHEIVSSTITDNKAVVKTKVTAPDLVSITGAMIKEIMGDLFALALTGADVESIAEKKSMEFYNKALSDPNVKLTTNEVDIELAYDEAAKKWIIQSNDKLTDAITGNLMSAFSKMDDSMASSEASAPASEEPKPDPTLYGINQEAQIGRAAITILDVKKSQGNDFDKPKTGMEYVVVTVRERNAGEGEISYDPFSFKVLNSNGQITDGSFSVIDSDTHFGSGALTSGGSVEGTVVFEAPINDPNLQFLFVPETEALLKFSLNQ